MLKNEMTKGMQTIWTLNVIKTITYFPLLWMLEHLLLQLLVWFIYCFGTHRADWVGKQSRYKLWKLPSLNVRFNISKLQISFWLPENKTEMGILKKIIFYFRKVTNFLLCWWLILSREKKASHWIWTLLSLSFMCVYQYHCEDNHTCPRTLQIWTTHKQRHKTLQQFEAEHSGEDKIRKWLFKTCASSNSWSRFYSELCCYERLARVNKSAVFLRFDFIKHHLTNSYGMFNMTLLLSSCPAWDRFLESSDTFIKSPRKVTHAAN